MSRRPVRGVLLGWLASTGLALAAHAADPADGDPVFDLDRLDRDAPVSIRSEELEATERDGIRTLVFEGNVEVEQGDLWIRAGRIEATYPAGARQPSRLRGRGGVRVGQGDREARCARVDYDRATEKLVCRGDAFLRDGADELRGDAIVFDLRARRVKVEGGTRVEIRPPSGAASDSRIPLEDLASGGPVQIRSDSLEVEETDAGRLLTFGGSVEIAQEDLTLRAQRVEALYPRHADEPSLLSATGSVRIDQPGREARCDEAVYDRIARRVDCRGAAQLQKGQDHLTGDEITFDLADERLVVTGNTKLVLAPREPETARP